MNIRTFGEILTKKIKNAIDEFYKNGKQRIGKKVPLFTKQKIRIKI